MLEFISTAYATQVPPVATTKDNLASLAPIFLIFFVFYFMLIRPQKLKQREHERMVSQLKIGDRVLVANSIIGQISKIKENEELIHLEIAPNQYIEVLKNNVTLFKEKVKPQENPKTEDKIKSPNKKIKLVKKDEN